MPLPHDDSYRPSDQASLASWRTKPPRVGWIEEYDEEPERIEPDLPANQTDDDATDE